MPLSTISYPALHNTYFSDIRECNVQYGKKADEIGDVLSYSLEKCPFATAHIRRDGPAEVV